MSTRREFLQAGGCLMMLLGASLGLSKELEALPVGWIDGETNPTGNERSYAIPAGDGVNVDRGAQVLLARYQGYLYAFSLACPHQQAVVEWLPRDHRFQCTKHGSRYTPQGVYMSGRATRNLDRFAIRKDAAQAIVSLTLWFQSDKDPAGWNAARIPV